MVGHARKNLVQGNALNTVYAMKENVPVKLITLAMIVPREDAQTTVQEKARAVVHQTTNVFAKTVFLIKITYQNAKVVIILAMNVKVFF